MFIRGQVWYWEDPICGKKEFGINVPNNDVNMRYNRYCIIAQTTKTITNNMILVIPCSSTNNDPNDVKIHLMHLFNENYSYAKIRSIFPANPKSLTRYICTLSEESMLKIEAEVMKLLTPTIVEMVNHYDIKIFAGIELDNKVDTNESTESKTESDTSNNNCQTYAYDEISNIRDFITQCVYKENGSRITGYDLKCAYDKYCKDHDMESYLKDMEFIDLVNQLILKQKYSGNVTNLRKIEFVDWAFKPSNLTNAESVIPDSKPIKMKKSTEMTDKKKGRRYSDEEKIKFLEFYKTNGKVATAKEYDLTISSVVSKFYKIEKYFKMKEKQ